MAVVWKSSRLLRPPPFVTRQGSKWRTEDDLPVIDLFAVGFLGGVVVFWIGLVGATVAMAAVGPGLMTKRSVEALDVCFCERRDLGFRRLS